MLSFLGSMKVRHPCTYYEDELIRKSPKVVKELGVGEKVQAIIPPTLAFGEKGICLESGECLVKPGATLVYDIYLKRSAIPPP